MKLYISGPMTGLEEYNYPAFFDAEATLVELGYGVVNPAHDCDCRPVKADWTDYMRCAIKRLLQADGVATLPGWMRSRGAMVEVELAEKLSMPVKMVSLWAPATSREG